MKGRFLPKGFENVIRRYVNECAPPLVPIIVPAVLPVAANCPSIRSWHPIPSSDCFGPQQRCATRRWCSVRSVAHVLLAIRLAVVHLMILVSLACRTRVAARSCQLVAFRKLPAPRTWWCSQVRALQQLQKPGHAAGQGQRHPHHVPSLPAGADNGQSSSLLPGLPCSSARHCIASLGSQMSQPVPPLPFVLDSGKVLVCDALPVRPPLRRAEPMVVVFCSAGHRGRSRPSRPVSWRGRLGDRRCRVRQ